MKRSALPSVVSAAAVLCALLPAATHAQTDPIRRASGTRSTTPLRLTAEESGPLSGEALVTSLNSLQPSVRSCVEPTDRSAEYKITIGRNGRVSDLQLVSTTDAAEAQPEAVRACLVRVLRQARFPAQRAASVASVRIQRDEAQAMLLGALRSSDSGGVLALRGNGGVVARTAGGGNVLGRVPARSHARVRLRTVRVRGGLSAAVVRRTAGRRTAELRRCYEAQVGRGLPFQGTTELTLTVSPDGSVAAVREQGATPPAQLSRCIDQRVRAWRFAEAASPTEIQQTLRFTMQAQGPGILGQVRERSPTPMVRVRGTTPPGGTRHPEIVRVVRRHTHELRTCYQTAYLADRTVAGTLTVGFTILPTGQVADASVVRTTITQPTPALYTCVLDRVRRWRFPASTGLLHINYPFVFAPN